MYRLLPTACSLAVTSFFLFSIDLFQLHSVIHPGISDTSHKRAALWYAQEPFTHGDSCDPPDNSVKGLLYYYCTHFTDKRLGTTVFRLINLFKITQLLKTSMPFVNTLQLHFLDTRHLETIQSGLTGAVQVCKGLYLKLCLHWRWLENLHCTNTHRR